MVSVMVIIHGELTIAFHTGTPLIVLKKLKVSSGEAPIAKNIYHAIILSARKVISIVVKVF